MDETAIDRTCRRGDTGQTVRRIQEWLSLHGNHVEVDGEFGPATEAAVKEFQAARSLVPTGGVDQDTFGRLVAPLAFATARIDPEGRALGALVVAYAQRHLSQHPREIGGQNRGPWVRTYMDGHEGAAWPWCAGFTCFCLAQASETLGMALPIAPSFSCDALAASAKARGRFIPEASPPDPSVLTPGAFFLDRATPTTWSHTGLVVEAAPEYFRTIEGNTNDDGSLEGYEVCARLRGYAGKDFIRI